MSRTGSVSHSLFVLLLMFGAEPIAIAGDNWTDWISPPWRKQPTIGVAYGPTRSHLEGVSLAPANTAVGELFLGGTRIAPRDSGAVVLRYYYQYFSIANFNNDFGPSSAAGEPTTNIWRFALGTHSGYGYQLGSEPGGAALLFYNGGDCALSSVDIRSTPHGMADSAVLYQYEGAPRFGNSVSGGVMLRITPLISVDAGFQRTVILRRMVFWPWLGSAILEGLLQDAIDGFGDKIGNASPMAKPITHFVLKNALSYGIYQLRKVNAYTPFPSEAPLFLDTFKVGLAFTF
jgi:hypothetical protein